MFFGKAARSLTFGSSCPGSKSSGDADDDDTSIMEPDQGNGQ